MTPADLIEQLEDSLSRIEAFARLDASVHARSYAPGKWNGRTIIAHLHDAELVFYGRFLKAIAEEDHTIQLFDHERWMQELDAASRPVPVSLSMLRAVTAGLTHHLVALPARIERAAHHPERGRMTALAMATQITRHRLHHLGQLDAIAAGREWTVAERVPY